MNNSTLNLRSPSASHVEFMPTNQSITPVANEIVVIVEQTEQTVTSSTQETSGSRVNKEEEVESTTAILVESNNTNINTSSSDGKEDDFDTLKRKVIEQKNRFFFGSPHSPSEAASIGLTSSVDDSMASHVERKDSMLNNVSANVGVDKNDSNNNSQTEENRYFFVSSFDSQRSMCLLH